MTTPAHDTPVDTIAPVEPTLAPASEPERFERAGEISDRLVDNIETVVYGKRDEIKLVLAALTCDGHVLLEDVPGTAKTVLARAIAGSIEGAVPQRIQCTPDLQPTDVTGLSVFDQRSRSFEFRPGPIFANVVLVDEINRATPKTQSALLEGMAERQVTVDGVTRELPYPFLVLATENPIEYEGTFPLPEAQLDRFFLRTALGYPGVEDELRILVDQRYSHPLGGLRPVIGLEEVHELRSAAQHVYVDDVLHRWVVDLVRATREQESVVIGSSVRGSLALERAARAWALLDGRSYVVPEDIERLFVPVLVHRVVFTPGFVARARATGWAETIEEFRQACLERAPRPGSEEDPLFKGGGGASTDGSRPLQEGANVPSARLTFPLVPRRRFVGISFGAMKSLRRGAGSDIAGSRPYRPGDDIDAIDWAASAKLSTAKGSDEFVVRERFAEQAPKIVIVCDRRPEMSFFGAPMPWLDKPQAMRTVVELILASAGAAGGFVGYLDYADGETHWRQPKGERKLIEIRDERLWSSEYGGPPDWLERSLAHLAEHPRAVGVGTFVFILSDFVPTPSKEMWLTAIEHRWDLVPVVIQDPTWEQSFPDVSGIVVSLRDPRTGRVAPVRLRAREARGRRAANEERVQSLLETFRTLDIDPILVSSSDPADILAPFLAWADLRRTRRVLGA